MIMNPHKDVLEYLDIKPKKAPDPLHMCFICWLEMPSDMAMSHTCKDRQEAIEPGVYANCSKCNALLHFGDFGNWIFTHGVDYYHKEYRTNDTGNDTERKDDT